MRSKLSIQGAIHKISVYCRTLLRQEGSGHHMHNGIQMEGLDHLTGCSYCWLRDSPWKWLKEQYL